MTDLATFGVLDMTTSTFFFQIINIKLDACIYTSGVCTVCNNGLFRESGADICYTIYNIPDTYGINGGVTSVKTL